MLLSDWLTWVGASSGKETRIYQNWYLLPRLLRFSRQWRSLISSGGSRGRVRGPDHPPPPPFRTDFFLDNLNGLKLKFLPVKDLGWQERTSLAYDCINWLTFCAAFCRSTKYQTCSNLHFFFQLSRKQSCPVFVETQLLSTIRQACNL